MFAAGKVTFHNGGRGDVQDTGAVAARFRNVRSASINGEPESDMSFFCSLVQVASMVSGVTFSPVRQFAPFELHVHPKKATRAAKRMPRGGFFFNHGRSTCISVNRMLKRV